MIEKLNGVKSLFSLKSAKKLDNAAAIFEEHLNSENPSNSLAFYFDDYRKEACRSLINLTKAENPEHNDIAFRVLTTKNSLTRMARNNPEEVMGIIQTQKPEDLSYIICANDPAFYYLAKNEDCSNKFLSTIEYLPLEGQKILTSGAAWQTIVAFQNKGDYFERRINAIIDNCHASPSQQSPAEVKDTMTIS
jgi:hypothetical protein